MKNNYNSDFSWTIKQSWFVVYENLKTEYFIQCGMTILGEKDLDRKFYLPDDSVTYIGGEEKTLTLREIIRRLEVCELVLNQAAECFRQPMKI